MNKNKVCIAWLVLCCAAGAAAQEAPSRWRPDGYFVQGGIGENRIASGTLGLTWGLPWERPVWWGLRASGHVELFASRWRSEAFNAGGYLGFWQVGVVPVLRLRPDEGRSPWFMEFGIGLSTMDRRYVTPDKQMYSRFNFFDVLGAGYSFGPDRRREVSLRYGHVSNADIVRPNPGEEFLLLRYGVKF